MAISLTPQHTAILGMDLQTGIVSVYAKEKVAFINRFNGIAAAGRQNGALIVHVTVSFRPGMPEVNPRNILFSGIKNSPERKQLFEGAAADIEPGIDVHNNDLIVRKSRVSAFTSNDLDMLLRANNINTLILCGIATSGVVLSTVLHASDMDYRMFIVEDCCTDLDDELHQALMSKVFPSRGTVLSATAMITAMNS